PCGSGKKYKRCCMSRDLAARLQQIYGARTAERPAPAPSRPAPAPPTAFRPWGVAGSNQLPRDRDALRAWADKHGVTPLLQRPLLRAYQIETFSPEIHKYLLRNPELRVEDLLLDPGGA